MRWIGLALLVGCGEATLEERVLAPTPWEGEEVRPPLTHPFFDDHPALRALSPLGEHFAGEDRPDHAHRGAYGVGNGLAFALMGQVDPVTTLHSAIGPTYLRESRFFGDTAVSLQVDGVEEPFHTAWIARVAGTAVMVTRQESDRYALTTVDHAPRGEPVLPMLARTVLVEPLDGVERTLAVAIHTARSGTVEEGMILDRIEGEDRLLATTSPGLDVVEDGGWTFPLDGDRLELLYVTGEDLEAVHATLDAAADQTADQRLEASLAWWADFSASGLQLETDDPLVDALYDAERVLVRVQQSSAGGVCPMSRYTRTWLRDSIGPVRFFTRAGLWEEAEAAVDYLYLCHRNQGDFANSCESGLIPEEVTRQPDWSSLPPFSGRTRAEGPSYVPLVYRELSRWTGDHARIDARWDYLERAVMAQELTEEGWQRWSGDETFRLAMNVALGFDLEVAWEDKAWSSNSGILMVAAASFLADEARRRGETAEAEALQERADRAKAGLESGFLQPEGHLAALRFFDDPATETRPFEDAALKLTWAGALLPEDPMAAAALEALKAYVDRGDGSFQSPADERYHLGTLGLEEGVATGMLPGYTLWALTAAGDPLAAAAFDQVHTYASPSGEYHEGLLYRDRSAFEPVYDANGVLGDVAARYRPWEGGIVLDAALAWLVGAEPEDGGLRLRPHVPEERLAAAPIRVGEGSVGLEVVRGPASVEATVRGIEGAVAVRLELPLPFGARPVALGGPSAASARVLPGGEPLVVFEAVTLEAGDEAAFTARW